jgi:nitroreductase
LLTIGGIRESEDKVEFLGRRTKRMEFEDLAKLMRSRRSIRRWQDREVPEALLTQAIELATWAPNAGNQQNWRFYVILNRDTIRTIADAVQDRADLIVSWPEAQELGYHGRWQTMVSFFRDAPAGVAVAVSRYQSVFDQILAVCEKRDPKAAQMRQWRDIANASIQSVSSAVANLLLILHQMGLGAVWMTGPMLAKGEIEKILMVPPEMDLIAFVPVGYPAESPAARERKPFAEACIVMR